MNFNSVFQSLTELFPQFDERILRTVAREHPTDADEAAAVVISEVVPLFPQEWEVHVPKRKLHHLPPCKVEPETQHEDALSQWLHPSHLPQSYLALLNEEEEEEKATPDLKPSLDYAVKKVVLPSRDAAAGARREVRTIYSASNKTASSVVKPSIRVQSQTNNEQLSGSSSKVPVAGRSSRKAAHPWSNYSEKLRSWKKRSSDFSQLHGQCKYVPSWQPNQSKCKSYTTERERKQRIDDNIKALAKLLPREVKEDSSEVILNEIVDHVKLLQLEMKGFGHYIHHEEMMTKPLEEMMEDLLANDPDAAARLLESKGLYLMPLSSVQDLC
uniref:BHLH domain-containing protein n=1 Tax=Brassica campestris TaxID=3711 RepID=M4E6E8_BRACM